MTLFFSACASNKAGLKSPELPAKHWLEEAPGVPVENKTKLEAAVPNLYDPSKVFTFEDCVFLTIQQSPLLVNSAVDLEIKRVALTDAVWKYLPEPRMTMQVTNNLTRNNMDHRDTPGDYGRTKLSVGFFAAFPNPVATYFEHQVQKAMVNLAISTHRKAVGEAIYKIAQAYLQLQAQKKIVKVQKDLLPIGKELIAYWQQVEAVDGRQGVSLNLAMQHQRELELMVEQTKMKETMQLTQLKILAGVDPQQRLDVDTANADDILKGFNGRGLKWDDRWNTTEDDLLLRGQTAHVRALDVFSSLRVWETAENNGVLIYVLLADHHIEIVADRGIHEHVGAESWSAICSRMESHFRQGALKEGLLKGLREISALLAQRYPATGPNPNELPDRPALLR